MAADPEPPFPGDSSDTPADADVSRPGEPYPPPAPPHRLHSASGGPGALRCLGCLVLVAAGLLLTLSLLRGGPTPGPFERLLPASALGRIDAPDWKQLAADPRRADIDFSARLADWLAAKFAVRALDVADLLHQVERAELALIPGRDGRPIWLARLQFADGQWAQKQLAEDIELRLESRRLEGRTVQGALLPDGGRWWLAELDGALLVSPELDALEFAFEAEKGQRPTLAENPPARELATPGPELLRGWFRPAAWGGLSLAGRGLTLLPPDSSSTDRIEFSLRRPAAGPTLTLVRPGGGAPQPELALPQALELVCPALASPLSALAPALWPEAVGERLSVDRKKLSGHRERLILQPATRPHIRAARGFWGWIWTILFWLILSPLIAIGLFLAAGIGLALWHYVAVWRAGELSPREPPVMPDLSPALREDLQAGPRRPEAAPEPAPAEREENPPPDGEPQPPKEDSE